ncbi:MAG: hypothetical protein ACI8TQ_002849 [Planctomycetota bacterium]|jgi:hypothetical protein
MNDLAKRLADLRLTDTAGVEVRLGELWQASGVIFTFLRHYG